MIYCRQFPPVGHPALLVMCFVVQTYQAFLLLCPHSEEQKKGFSRTHVSICVSFLHPDLKSTQRLFLYMVWDLNPLSWPTIWVFQSANALCLCTYLNRVLLSSGLCSSEYPSPVHVHLDLCLSIYFILLFWVIVHGIGFLILVSRCSMLVHQNVTDFCVLYLCILFCDLAELPYYFSRTNKEFCRRFLRIFYVDNHIICKVNFFISALHSYLLLFRLELPGLCWVRLRVYICA